MPQTFNGIGTWYYGKKNKHVRDDTCEHCGNYTELTSYDTRNFVVFVYIPIIPLGRFRVVDECGACTKHYAVPLAEWDEQKKDAVGEAVSALERDPWNSENAMELVRTCAGYHDRESLARHESGIDQALSNDASGMAFLGSAYEYFKEPEKAEGAYRKSLTLKDDPGVRHSLGILLINQRRPAEAKEFVWHLLTPSDDDDFTTLYFLVEAYQAQGMHREASKVLDAMSQNVGGLENDEIFQKYRKRVSKRAGSTRPLASPLMKGKPLGYDNSRTVLTSAAVIVAVVSVAGFFLFQETQRLDVYLVNGLDRAYNVRISGETHHLAPLATIEITIPRRAELPAEVSEQEIGWPATVNLSMTTNFWSSLFERRTYVVNPDRTAVIVWEQTEYRVNPTDGENPTRVHLRRGLHSFDNLDYVFEEFPDEITLDSAQSTERRDRIWRIFDLEPTDAYSAALELGIRTDGVAYVIARLRANPADEATLPLAASVVPAKEFAELARPQLDARPLEMEWHRMYQTALEAAGRGGELVNDYRGLLDAEPDNADLQYLLARVTPDPDAAERLMRASAESDPPSAYGVHGLAYQRVIEARFQEALKLARRAQDLEPDNALFSYAENEALLALRRFDALIEETDRALEENPYDGNSVAQAVRLHVAAGERQRAQEIIDAFVQLRKETEEDAELWRTYLDSLYHLGSGNWKAYQESTSTVEEPRWQYQAAVANGDIVAALDALEATESTAYDRLIVYITARRAGEPNVAEEELQTAIAALSEGTMDERVLARCLGGDAPRDIMLKLGLQPETKAIALAALTVQSGDARLRQLGRKLNYQLIFERYYLDRVVY